MKRIRFHVKTQLGLESFLPQFVAKIRHTLAHPLGWERASVVRFKETSLARGLKLQLVTPDYISKQLGQEFGNLSVADRSTNTVYINLDRWTNRNPDKSGLSLEGYRTYVINHEVGHLLGMDHPSAQSVQEYVNYFKVSGMGPPPAPIMIQQTLGIQGCKPNMWPLHSELLQLKQMRRRD